MPSVGRLEKRENYRTEEGVIQLSHRMFEQDFERFSRQGTQVGGEYKKERKKKAASRKVRRHGKP